MPSYRPPPPPPAEQPRNPSARGEPALALPAPVAGFRSRAPLRPVVGRRRPPDDLYRSGRAPAAPTPSRPRPPTARFIAVERLPPHRTTRQTRSTEQPFRWCAASELETTKEPTATEVARVPMAPRLFPTSNTRPLAGQATRSTQVGRGAYRWSVRFLGRRYADPVMRHGRRSGGRRFGDQVCRSRRRHAARRLCVRKVSPSC